MKVLRHALQFLTVIVLLGLSSIYATASKVPAQFEQQCISCHQQMVSGDHTLLYTRKDRRIKNYAQLQQRVDYCQAGSQLGWNQRQIADVVDYLNRSFYKFDRP